ARFLLVERPFSRAPAGSSLTPPLRLHKQWHSELATAHGASPAVEAPLGRRQGEVAELAKAEHADGDRASDPVGAEEPDEVVDAGDRNAVPRNHEVLTEETCRRGRPARLDGRQYRAGAVGDPTRQGMATRDCHGLRGDSDEGTADATVPDQLADDEADRVAG